MVFIEIGLSIVGIGLLIVGYRKNSRDLMLTGAICLAVGGHIGDVVSGFVDGVAGDYSP